MRRGATLRTGIPTLVTRVRLDGTREVTVYQAHPVAPTRASLDAAVRYVEFMFGISLQNAIDVAIGSTLGSYILLDRRDRQSKGGAHL